MNITLRSIRAAHRTIAIMAKCKITMRMFVIQGEHSHAKRTKDAKNNVKDGQKDGG